MYLSQFSLVKIDSQGLLIDVTLSILLRLYITYSEPTAREEAMQLDIAQAGHITQRVRITTKLTSFLFQCGSEKVSSKSNNLGRRALLRIQAPKQNTE